MERPRRHGGRAPEPQKERADEMRETDGIAAAVHLVV